MNIRQTTIILIMITTISIKPIIAIIIYPYSMLLLAKHIIEHEKTDT